MRKLTLTAAFLMLATSAIASPTAPNAKTYQSGITYAEFLAANGCTLVDMGGYSNAKGPNGGACTALVDWSRAGGGYLTADGADLNAAPDWVRSEERRVGKECW